MGVTAKRTVTTLVVCPASRAGTHEDTVSVGELRAFLAKLDALAVGDRHRVEVSGYHGLSWVSECEIPLSDAA